MNSLGPGGASENKQIYNRMVEHKQSHDQYESTLFSVDACIQSRLRVFLPACRGAYFQFAGRFRNSAGNWRINTDEVSR